MGSNDESVVRRYFDGCDLGDAEMIRQTLHDDVVHFWLDERREPIRGADHLARFWAKMKTSVGAHWSIDHLVSSSDEVVLEWTVYWTHPTSGRRLVNRGTDWYVMRAERIAEVRAYFHFPIDPAEIDRDSELRAFPYGERGYLLDS